MDSKDAFERCMKILTDTLKQEIRYGKKKDARYALGKIGGALLLAYALGLITDQQNDELFHEANMMFFNADFTDRR